MFSVLTACLALPPSLPPSLSLPLSLSLSFPPSSSGGQTPRRDLEKQLTGEEK